MKAQNFLLLVWQSSEFSAFSLTKEVFPINFWPHGPPCGTLVPSPGVEPMPPAAEVQNLTHWPTRNVPEVIFLHLLTLKCLQLKIIYMPSLSHIVMCVFQCCSLNPSHPLLPPLCPQVCSLRLGLMASCCKTQDTQPGALRQPRGAGWVGGGREGTYVYIWLSHGDVRDGRGWDGCMASPTRWAWVWVNSGSWWWTGRPGVLRFMGSQRIGHDWETELTWTDGRNQYDIVRQLSFN